MIMGEAGWGYKLVPIKSEINDTSLNTCISEAARHFNECDRLSNFSTPDLCGKKQAEATQICWDKWHATDRSDLEEAGEIFMREAAYHWYGASFVSLVPILLAWLIVYAFIGLWRWIRRGFTT
jgi:hypothetical protein